MLAIIKDRSDGEAFHPDQRRRRHGWAASTSPTPANTRPCWPRHRRYDFDFDENTRGRPPLHHRHHRAAEGVYFSHRRLVLHTWRWRRPSAPAAGPPAPRRRVHADHADVPRARLGRALHGDHARHEAGLPRPLCSPDMLPADRQRACTFSTACRPSCTCCSPTKPARMSIFRLQDDHRRGGLPKGPGRRALARDGRFLGYGCRRTCPILTIARPRRPRTPTPKRPASASRRLRSRWWTSTPSTAICLTGPDGKSHRRDRRPRAPWLTHGLPATRRIGRTCGRAATVCIPATSDHRPGRHA